MGAASGQEWLTERSAS